MQNTTNYNLKKPESNEFVNVDDINGNMDIIDEKLKNIDDSKVTKIDGKGLSTNDYTTAEKEKLATLNNYDDSGLRQELSEKTGINAKATYTNNTVTITAPISAQQITFIAPSNFSESDTYTLNGTQITITDLNNEPLSNAWKQGSPVQLTIKGNQGFFKSGGGDSKLNIFAQPTQPPINEGIWLQTNDKFKNVQVANNVVQSGSWSSGNEYEDMPNVRGDFGCVSVGDNVYFIGGHVFMGMSTPGKALSNIDVYNTKTRSWSKIADMPFTNNSFGCVAIGAKIYCFGGYKNYNNIKHDTSFVFDTTNGTWSELPKMPFADVNFGCAFVGKKVYCTGGESYQQKLQIFDIDNSNWSQGAEKPDSNWEIGLESLNDEIFCVGGRNSYGNAFEIVYKYNVIENTWSKANNFPERIFDAVCISEKGKLYCVGGRTKNESGRYFQLPDSYVYDEKLDSWEHIGFLPTPAADKNGCACNGKLYLSGGWDAAGIYYKSLDVYDVDLKKWSLNAALRQARYAHKSIVYDGKIYTIGGAYNASDYFDTVEIYDIETNAWAPGRAMPSKRSEFGCVSHNGKIYCIGGRQGANDITNKVQIYDTETNTWAIGKDIPEIKEAFGCVLIGNKIYCIGGRTGNLTLEWTNSVFSFDVTTETWSSEPAMKISKGYFGCAVVGDKIYCMGGKTGNTTYLQDVSVFDTKLNTWDQGVNMPTNRNDFGCVAVNGKIYCIGGNINTYVYDDVYVYDTKTSTWQKGTKLLKAVSNFGCIHFGFNIYVVGGNLSNSHENSNATNLVQIMTLVPTKFPENTLVLQNTIDGKNKYYTQLINSKQLFGDRLLTGFENAWIYANEKLKEYPAYYGDGEKWNKFKN